MSEYFNFFVRGLGRLFSSTRDGAVALWMLYCHMDCRTYKALPCTTSCDFDLFYRYTWAETFEGIIEEAVSADAATFGIGAAINCNFALLNLETEYNKVARGISANPTDATMGNHPGAGANTIQHDLRGTAKTSIQAG